MDIYVTIVIIILAVTAMHYFPWRPLLGRDAPQILCYMAGTLVVMLPASGLLLLWNKTPPAYFQRVTVTLILVVVWACILAAGTTILVLTGLDNFLETRARMLAAEDDRRLARERMDKDGTEGERS
jgi:hypothetical protein